MGWFSGPLGVAGISMLGATPAGLQTWCLGRVTIAIARHGGSVLEAGVVGAVVLDARATFSSVRDDARRAARREPVR